MELDNTGFLVVFVGGGSMYSRLKHSVCILG